MKSQICAALFAVSALTVACSSESSLPPYGQVQGWNILSDSYDDALVTLAAAREYNVNHLQLSHHLIMDLREIREPERRAKVTSLIDRAHEAGIPEVVLWDHALYGLDYYPEEFKTGPDGTINLDNPEFWEWFRADYRQMLDLVPSADGLVLTFIETGTRAERQYSEKWSTGPEKLAAVVDCVADVVCREYGKKLYVRTFAYTDAEYANTIGCLEHVRSREIILMMKETPHDFFLTHPNDKYAGTIDRPTIIEFDTGGEFNGQGIITNTWPEYVLGRWSRYVRLPNIIGYVARTDRYGNTRLVGTPNEILLDALKSYTADTTVTADRVYDSFISRKYGPAAVDVLKPAFQLAFDIVTSSLYTLGTNTANHSALNYDPYRSSYARHVSGKWIDPPIAHIRHGVDRDFHYWKDVIEHLAPARLKTADGPIRTEAPAVIDSSWVTPVERMNEDYLKWIITEKQYGVKLAEQALQMVESSKGVLEQPDYLQLTALFGRTLLTARLHEAAATAYWGYRIYARGEDYRTPWLKQTLSDALERMTTVADEIERFGHPIPVGQWNWQKDAQMVSQYYEWITQGWPEYGNVRFITHQ